jgi:NAD+ synthase (glutamine-hydrolysing)
LDAAVKEGDKQVLADAVRVGNYQPGELPEAAEEFAHRLLLTVYMGTENRYMSYLTFLGSSIFHL